MWLANLLEATPVNATCTLSFEGTDENIVVICEVNQADRAEQRLVELLSNTGSEMIAGNGEQCTNGVNNLRVAG